MAAAILNSLLAALPRKSYLRLLPGGDWQIAAWLLRRVPMEDAGRYKNPLSWLSQWKIFDNLRRSLAPLALVALLFAGWSLAVLAIVLTPALLASLLETLRRPVDVPWRRHLAAASRSSARHLAQAAFTLACLPYHARSPGEVGTAVGANRDGE